MYFFVTTVVNSFFNFVGYEENKGRNFWDWGNSHNMEEEGEEIPQAKSIKLFGYIVLRFD